jgi:anion-transporting  ArsA/GET3 family ATPase
MPAAVLERRLQFVVGKGGVGKTTVTAALARVAVRQGRRTLAVEMESGGRLARLLGGTEGDGYTPRAVTPDLHVMTIDGRAALEEYLGLVIPVKRLLSTVFSSRIYQYFVAAAPGLKELMSVGKIWYEATRTEAGRPAWDAIVVDAPATGHSLQVLRMPEAARQTFGAGLVQREATKIMDLLRNAETTAVHLVTLAEEMPVAETLETCAELVKLGLPLGAVIVNRVHRRRFPDDVVARVEAARGRSAEERALLGAVAACAAEESGWAAINAGHLARLRQELSALPLVELPFLFVEEFDRAEVELLAAQLDSVLAGGHGRAAERRQRP